MRSSILLAVLLDACAFDLAHVAQQQAVLVAAAPAQPPFSLERSVDIRLPYSYQRTLKAGSRWTYVGHIGQGDVFKSPDQVLTVEASNVYEAYIVVSAGRLLGFYLPVERSFSPVAEPMTLPTRGP